MNPDDQLLTVNEVAERLRVHPITIRRHIKAGKLRAVRIGRAVRVRESDILALVTVTPYDWPPKGTEQARLERIVKETLEERDRLPPLGMTTVDLLREAREETDEPYRTPPGLDRRRIRRHQMVSEGREGYEES